MVQLSLFGPSEAEPDPKPADDRPVRMRILVTVKAAPNPSAKYGETVCVAGLRVDLLRTTWVRLYPINFRYLDSDEAFKKYDIISVDAKPARQDPRRESWKPIGRIRKEKHMAVRMRDDGCLTRSSRIRCAVSTAMPRNAPTRSRWRSYAQGGSGSQDHAASRLDP